MIDSATTRAAFRKIPLLPRSPDLGENYETAALAVESEVLKKMKVLSALMLFILCGVYANAQEARVIAEIAAGNEKMVKNAPFSAEAVSESVQVLADGNRIVRSSTSKLYRNSEGRFRREMSGGGGGVLGTYYGFGKGVSILDPVVGHRVMLDTYERTARVVQLGSGQNIAIAGRSPLTAATKPLTDAKRAELEAKLLNSPDMSEEQKTKLRRQLREAKTYAEVASAAAGGTATVVAPSAEPVTVVSGEGNSYNMVYKGSFPKYETRSEDLGTRDFDGVTAAGTRTVTTIPAGSIGNERDIEIVYERWYSKELEIVVYSKHSDPRFGEQTYRLTNIIRSEPDPSLFTVPHGYRVLSEPPNVYKISTRPSAPAQSAIPAVPRPPKAITVNASKP